MPSDARDERRGRERGEVNELAGNSDCLIEIHLSSLI